MAGTGSRAPATWPRILKGPLAVPSSIRSPSRARPQSVLKAFKVATQPAPYFIDDILVYVQADRLTRTLGVEESGRERIVPGHVVRICLLSHSPPSPAPRQQ